MRSKTSFINRGILLNDFKRFAWISAGYLLVLLLSVPLKVLMLYSKLEDVRIYGFLTYLRLFQFDSNVSLLHVMSIIIVPVLTGILLFRYLQDSQAADMAHALPVKRRTIYNTHVLAGVTFLFVPLILTALISLALVAGLGIEQVNSSDVLSWLYVSLLINLLFFMSSVAVGMITGMSTLQGVLSIILLLLPSGLSVLLLHNMSKYIYGFAYVHYFQRTEKLSPLIRLTETYQQPFGPVEIAVYLLCGIALYYVGRYLYQQRPIEMAGHAIAFDVLRPVFKYSVTFCSMLLLGSYFNGVQNSMAWTFFGYLLGSLLAYILIEILLNKSLQVFQWQRLKGYGIYFLTMIALIGLFHFDFSGYEKRLPELSEVKNIYLDNSYYPLDYTPAVNAQAYAGDYGSPPPVRAIYTEKDSIANIYALHQKIVANISDDKDSSLSKRINSDSASICLAYELKNGGRFYRQYQIAAPDYADKLKPIYESREHKQLYNPITTLNPADAALIEINSFEVNKNLRIVDQELLAQAVAVLQRDIYDETYEEGMNQRPPWAHITVYSKDHLRVELDWNKSYISFEHWLKETGKHSQSRLLPGEDISSMIVEQVPVNKREQGKRPANINQELLELENKPGVLKVSDPEKIELCLRNYGVNVEQAAYKVFFLLNTGGSFSGFISEADAPTFVKEHFTR